MKKDIWEKKFSDNYKANFIEKLVKKYETYRQDEIIKLLPPRGNLLVDLACGDGNLMKAVQGKFKRLTGFDIAANRIKNARSKQYTNNNVVFKVADLDNGIPLKSQSADVIVCEGSVGYFYDSEYFLREVNRVLKLNGVFVTQVANIAFLFRRLSLLIGKLPRTSAFKAYGDGGVLHYFTYSVFKELLSDHGFKVTHQTNSGIFPSLRKIWPSLLAGDMIFKAVKVKLV